MPDSGVSGLERKLRLNPCHLFAGEISIYSDDMSWNSTKGTYQLDLLAKIPIYNPNFLSVRAEQI